MVSFHGGRVDEVKIFRATCFSCEKVVRFESVNPHAKTLPDGWQYIHKREPEEFYSDSYLYCEECMEQM